MAVVTQGQWEKLRLGKVINNTVSFIGRNLIFSLVVGALFFVLPALLASLGVFSYLSRLPSIACGGQWAPEAFMLASGLLATALNFVGYAVLSRATIDGIKGDRPSVGGSIQAALRYSLPIVGIGFAIYLAVFFASYAMLRTGLLTPSEALAALAVLVAPFIPWGLRTSVAVPVAILERLGVRASMLRSRALTKGHRWPIVGLFLIVITLFVVRQVGLALAVVFVLTALTPVSAFIVGSLLDALVWAMIWMPASIAITVTYMELRRIKEGASVGELAEIFS
jgi:hypothetical protein